MKHRDDTFDLASEARRRTLKREEEARLEMLLEESPEDNMLYRAGLEFDRDSSAREGDDVLIARLASRGAERFARPAPPARRARGRRRATFTLLVAALVAAGTAAAGSGVVYLVRTQPKNDVAPKVAVTSPDAKASERRARPAPVTALAAPAPVVEAPSPVVRAERARPTPAVIAPSSKRVSEPLGAAALFGEANKRRLAGDSAGAVALYASLAERFPGSSESNLAELSLGKLFLASGNTERALTYFRRAGATGGALGSEAMWGEAGALRALGRTSEERALLERLLAKYPSGAYAKAARKRLGTDPP